MTLVANRLGITMSPKEMSEGGLCGVEQRVQYELGHNTGARNVEIQE